MRLSKTAKILAFFTLLCAVPITSSLDVAAFDVIGVGGVGFSNPQVEPPAEYNAKARFGLGACVSWEVAPFISLETGALFIPRKYEAQSVSTNTEESFSTVQLPFLARVSPAEFFSLGLGPYVAFHTGTLIETTSTRMGNASVSTERTLDRAGIGNNEAGLEASARIAWPLLPTIGVVLDLRYLHELTNSSTRTGITLRFTDLQFLTGVRFGLEQ